MATGGGKRGVKKSAGDLSIKERIFVREYLKDENGTRSVIAAGWAAGSAAVTASKLLKKPKIRAAIAKVSARVMDDLDVSVAQIVAELKKVGFFDPRKLFESDGSPKQILDLDDNTASVIAGLEVNELFDGNGEQKHAYGLVKKIKLADKLKALELLGRYRKMFTDKTEVTGADGGAIVHEIRGMKAVRDALYGK